MICHADTRQSSLKEIERHAFYAGVAWTSLRSQPVPFIPSLASETDTGYFDAFDNPEHMAKYKDVKEKQRKVEAVSESAERVNRGGLSLPSLFFGCRG